MLKKTGGASKLALSLIATVAMIFMASNSFADAGKGKATFKAKKCGGACHQTAGPANEKTFADQLKKKGPELWYAGSKFKKDFVSKWLQDPKPIRPMAYNSMTVKNKANHPKLSAGDAANVTDYLMTLTSKDVEVGAVKAKKNIQGKLMFQKKQACQACHLFKKRKKIVGGLVAPSLVGAKERLQPDWVYAYLLKPKVFKPVKRMPVYNGIISEPDMKNLAQYVGTLK